MKSQAKYSQTGNVHKSSPSIKRRLAAYSATAGAAMLGIPSGVLTAQASIQEITGPSITATTISFPLSHASYFGARVKEPLVAGPFNGSLYGLNLSHHGGGASSFGGVAAINGNLAHPAGYYLRAARPLKSAAFAGLLFNNGTHDLAADQSGGGVNGSFQGTHKTGYVAFKTGGYYGWLKAQVHFDTAHGWADKLTLVSNGTGVFGAFDKISDTVADNFKVGTLTATPEPSTLAIGGLGLLAMGASGIRELRRRRQARAETAAKG